MLYIETYTRGPVPEAIKKNLAWLFRLGWEAVGKQWHANMRPEHFTHRGATKYGYSPRNKKYELQKFRRFGHTYPLVWTGASRTLAGIRNVRATPDGVRVVMNTPTLNFRRGKLGSLSGAKTLREEMTTVTQDEVNDLTAGWAKEFNRNLDAMQDVQTKRL